MEWGATPLVIGLAGVYAAVISALEHYRGRKRAAARRATAARVDTATAVTAEVEPLERSA